MAKVKIRVTADDVEQSENGGEFELPPVGLYTATLTECKPGFKKAEGGGEDKSAPRIECTYTIDGVGPEGKSLDGKRYGNLWDYVTFSEAAGWKRAEFLKAMGLPVQAKGGEFEVDTDDLVGKRVVVRVKHEPDRQNDGQKRSRLANLQPFGDKDTAEAFGAASESAADDSDAFAGEDDAPASDDGDELWTEDELKALDMKELGAAAKEFDINPNDFVKKVRGKNKVDVDGLVSSILEAQGTDDEEPTEGDEATEDDDESPF